MSELFRIKEEGLAEAVGLAAGATDVMMPLLRDFDFDVLVCGDHVARKKPDSMAILLACERLGVAPGEALFIGDSDNDVTAARAAGCAVWCVPYGYNEGRPPSTLACDRRVATLADAADLLGH